ncbi:MAG: tRNA (N(6)-L-threonylcarbamoyladenosine(37)-C(2))-methylthiotransferase MtaB [Gammaproteobacteria bacterium]|nr:tRNA (N(6)-L-threonylcarbamoyladenosine(37)-C(2))-methylthiotransferase MtaB [Gammaproteobacteria bacterium]
MRVALNTLGCRLNEAELENWSNGFQRLGYSITKQTADADLIVVNTCAVTKEAVKKSRQLLRKSHRLNPQAKLVVSGCYGTLDPEAVNGIDGIDLLIPNKDKDDLVKIVSEQLFRESMPLMATEAGETPLFSRGRNRAFIKVQDGCRYRCAFCIVTVARGSERSRSPEKIVSEINLLASQGIKEVILTGVHIGGYGSDINTSICDLIQTVLSETDIPRLRLGSIEPWDLGDDFLKLFENPRFMPHLHLPLQSGSNTVLRRMARRCLVEEYEKLISEIRSSISNFNLTTDIIVGFPGESDKEWRDSLDFIESCEFSHIHIFPYSQREGTRAAISRDQLSPATKKARTQELHALALQSRQSVLNTFKGLEFPVLFENSFPDDIRQCTGYTGYTSNYLKVKVMSNSELSLENEIVPVRLIKFDETSNMLEAELLC